MAKQLELDLGRPAWHETNLGYALKRDTSRTSTTSADQTSLETSDKENRQNWRDQPSAESASIAS